MEVAIVDKDTIKIKGKTSNFIVDPTQSMSKTQTDAVIFLSDFDDSVERVVKADEYRVVIKGAGSFEVGGVRIAGTKTNKNFSFSLGIDGLSVFLARTSGLEKQEEKASCNVLILNVDSEFKESMVSSYEPSVVVLYGEKAEDAVKALGKEHQTVSKFVQTADKLPVDTQIIQLK